MKIIFEDVEDISYPTDVEQYAESFKRAMAISENLESIENYEDEVGTLNPNNVKSIVVYGSNYSDEFYIDPVDTNKRELYLEVLTKTEAESNEREYIRGNTGFTKEERENYKLGETVQWYKPLGSSGYWYTLK